MSDENKEKESASKKTQKKVKTTFERFDEMVKVFSPLRECLECFTAAEIKEIEAQKGAKINEVYLECLRLARLNFRKLVWSAAIDGNAAALKQIKIQMELCREKQS